MLILIAKCIFMITDLLFSQIYFVYNKNGLLRHVAIWNCVMFLKIDKLCELYSATWWSDSPKLYFYRVIRIFEHKGPSYINLYDIMHKWYAWDNIWGLSKRVSLTSKRKNVVFVKGVRHDSSRVVSLKSVIWKVRYITIWYRSLKHN